MGPKLVASIQVNVNPGVITIKEHSTFPTTVYFDTQVPIGDDIKPFKGKQYVYSTMPDDRVKEKNNEIICIVKYIEMTMLLNVMNKFVKPTSSFALPEFQRNKAMLFCEG